MDSTKCLCMPTFTRDIGLQSKLQRSILNETGIKPIFSVNKEGYDCLAI